MTEAVKAFADELSELADKHGVTALTIAYVQFAPGATEQAQLLGATMDKHGTASNASKDRLARRVMELFKNWVTTQLRGP